ncbi:hypothetical protein GCM10025881_17850 [Pseudolysinimonas kribbensis]|uniref:HTH lacI-type domain-containing protein n=1 Tax=Pseudolysinimonas kribbensis TaxID=433641 RepID=A0ABQ6K2Z1_9MICO|nr:LacI family DNA-binding transcriptional regulator [Pseudolysinimonas kribbensis]GMA94961.1 hypothetical protein GCM10025881_17850 [Pseudolysinimonas kribbensis]
MTVKRVTLADVARRAGVSPTAASMILNGKPDTRLSADAHARVNAAARDLGYRPNIGARALRTDRTYTIGFISDVVATTRFASGLIKGALEEAESAGHVVLVLETGASPPARPRRSRRSSTGRSTGSSSPRCARASSTCPRCRARPPWSC